MAIQKQIELPLHFNVGEYNNYLAAVIDQARFIFPTTGHT